MLFIKELKRRNVFRAGLAYLATAWLLIQVADTVFPVYGVPPATLTILITIIGLCFVPVLVVAWAFEFTWEGVKRDRDVDRSSPTAIAASKNLDRLFIVMLVLALSYFAVDKFVLDPARDIELVEEATLQGRTQALIESNTDKSIAVLPFVNMSDDPDNEYFSDGISEELLNLLAKIPELKVIARTSSFAFKGRNEDLRVIGQTLGVETVLEGSVRRFGNRVRITAQLNKVSDGSRIWSDSYERTLDDIFAVQDDVAAAIIDSLQIHVSSHPTRGRPTNNPESYAMFLKARALINSHQGGEALEILQQVTELDPNFAEAHELLAASYWSAAGGAIDKTEGFERSAESAAKALAIDPDLAYAQALYDYSQDRPVFITTGIKAFERAWRKQPGNTAPMRPLIYELSYAGYQLEARRIAEIYLDLDPLSPGANYSLGETLFALGQSAEALDYLTIAYNLDDEFAQWFLPVAHLIEGNDDMAIALYEKQLERIGVADTTWVRDLVTGGRDPLTGQSYLDRRVPQIVELIPDEHVRWWRNNFINLYLAFDFIDRFYEIILAVGPDGKIATDTDVRVWEATLFRQTSFTSHPRYLEVVELLDITRIWEQRGPPDFCENEGGEWVCE